MEPLTEIKASLATHRTKPGSNAQTLFRRESHLRDLATERLYKGAPPSAPIDILISHFEPQTSQLTLKLFDLFHLLKLIIQLR